ncbi:helix-turn-helix domain-containing protein [Actinosynnema sp. NPDC020468]|uniref:helix-turn-helix transcriptional regulator n=1 Tax=Actinosynnema sp. NPDC020468 TaxID=3154488 RepID=UPI0033CCDC0B
MEPAGDRRRGVGRRRDDLRNAAIAHALDRYANSVSEAVAALRADPGLPASTAARLDDLDRELTRVLRRANTAEDAHAHHLATHLTRREWQCLRLLAQGFGTSAIAEGMGVSTTTVRTHIQSLLGKLGVHSRLQAVALTARTSLLAAEPIRPTRSATAHPRPPRTLP